MKLGRLSLLVPLVAIVMALALHIALAEVPVSLVTGGGTFLSGGVLGAARFLGVNASTPGSGEFQMSGRTPAGLTFALHAEVACVNVAGSVAYLGGTVLTGTGSDGLDATGKVLRARLDDGSPDHANVSFLAVGTPIPADCFVSVLTTSGAALNGNIVIKTVP